MSVVSYLTQSCQCNSDDLFRLAIDAPRRYKVYSIAKRTSGYRTIAHPSAQLKKVQYQLISAFSQGDSLLTQLAVHSQAMAYKKGIGIKENAKAHSQNSYLLKMDFEQFFNSITPELFWRSYHASNPETVLSRTDKKLLELFLFWAPNKYDLSRLVLSVGAPSSPLISNFCMYQFDELMYRFCQKKQIVYTRYADDITFSTNVPDVLFTIPKKVDELLKGLFFGAIMINHQKTVFSSRAHNKHVTGVTITPKGDLSLGRDRKRYIKHLIHQFTLGNLTIDDLNHLRGLLSFSQYIEPSFISSLQKKYSVSIIDSISRGHYER
ncbi:retron St85 family RNA-directed DNA polymerase [Vibrio splendidus]